MFSLSGHDGHHSGELLLQRDVDADHRGEGLLRQLHRGGRNPHSQLLRPGIIFMAIIPKTKTVLLMRKTHT